MSRVNLWHPPTDVFELEDRVVVIDKGEGDVKRGDEFSVFRGDLYLGNVKVGMVGKHLSACDIVLIYKNRRMHEGDWISRHPIPGLYRKKESTK